MVLIISWPKLIEQAFQFDDLANTDKRTDYSERYQVKDPLIL